MSCHPSRLQVQCCAECAASTCVTGTKQRPAFLAQECRRLPQLPDQQEPRRRVTKWILVSDTKPCWKTVPAFCRETTESRFGFGWLESRLLQELLFEKDLLKSYCNWRFAFNSIARGGEFFDALCTNPRHWVVQIPERPVACLVAWRHKFLRLHQPPPRMPMLSLGQGSAVSGEDVWTSLAFKILPTNFGRCLLDTRRMETKLWTWELRCCNVKNGKGSTPKVSLPTSFGKKESSNESIKVWTVLKRTTRCSWIHLFCQRRGLATGCHGTWPRRVLHPSAGRVPEVGPIRWQNFNCSATENLKVTDFIPFHKSKNCRWGDHHPITISDAPF